MVDLAFEPCGGLQGLPLGSSKETVRAFFGNGHQLFKRSHESNPADYWPVTGVFAYYDDAHLLEALEFSGPSDPKLNGVSFMMVAMAAAIERLRLLDPELSIEPGSATSRNLGISIWSPTDELSQSVMSVITFGPGYYD